MTWLWNWKNWWNQAKKTQKLIKKDQKDQKDQLIIEKMHQEKWSFLLIEYNEQNELEQNNFLKTQNWENFSTNRKKQKQKITYFIIITLCTKNRIIK